MIPDDELVERFVRASGPGGQNVNKVSSAVELRFDVAASRALGPSVKARLAVLAGRRMTHDGVLVLFADEHRTQERNRAAARARLMALIERALVPPRARRVTRPPRAAKERRHCAKAARGAIKAGRARPPAD